MIGRASVCKPALYFESIDCLGECSYVVEESPSIQQNMLVSTTQAKGRVLRLKSRDKFWVQYFLCSNYGSNFVDKDVLYHEAET